MTQTPVTATKALMRKTFLQTVRQTKETKMLQEELEQLLQQTADLD